MNLCGGVKRREETENNERIEMISKMVMFANDEMKLRMSRMMKGRQYEEGEEEDGI